MLTPRFEITQTDAEVTIVVHAPYVNIKDTEVYVDGTDFRFLASPYYLRLRMPGAIEENSTSSGDYDCEKGDFTLRFSKVNKGEHFENLDMITTLLAPPKSAGAIIPNIEVIGNPSAASADICEGNALDDSGNEWFVPQDNVPEVQFLVNSPKYGFANKKSGILHAFEAAWVKDITDLPTPDTTPETERKTLQQQRELNDFCENHYIADLVEVENIKPCITYAAEWDTLQKDQVALSEAEVDILKELPNREYLLDSKDVQKLCFNVIDILYASCYNHRTTLGENTSESSWTINKLSSTLCWFQNFTSLDEVITACIRRSLCYPIYRNWELSIKVFEDLKIVLSLGRKYIVKRFCEIHSLFNESYEMRYVLNQLYIIDFLIWLQTLPESVIESLHSALSEIHPNKASMGFHLIELEVATYSVQEEDFVIENTIHKMTDNIDQMTLNDSNQEKPKNVYHVNQKFFKYLLSSSSSSTDSSDSDTDSDSNTSSSSSSSSSLDSDDLDDEPK
ncbi:PREDICTED: protein SHQ1 homolog isoform X2 [Vollenhovia emeryi]|uniref:protein SHQ1 homolog isoform X2 n=1 Tax=Vollenhovia emeryi TaxID=411798 RepID=UPI0005F3DF99|nr:PREDICTED: protein SHQ1 homolog isoform X2 [Vollenhovia emeryi]